MKYSLKQLEVFLATAHHQNISLAAQELAMSQSAASESLKKLESQFDIQLFDRIGKRLQLNELGKLVRRDAQAFIERANALEKTLQQHAKVGIVKVGATLSIGNYLAINILSKFKNEHPEADVSLEVANTTQIANKVLNFELDVGLIEGEFAHPDLLITPWREDELVIFCSSDHPYSHKKNLSDSDLIQAQWVLRETGSGTRQAFDYAMHGLTPQLSIALELQHTEAIKRAVERNLGLGCLSQITLNDEFERGSLKPLRTQNRNFKRQFYSILHKDKYISAGIKSWLAICDNFDTIADTK